VAQLVARVERSGTRDLSLSANGEKNVARACGSSRATPGFRFAPPGLRAGDERRAGCAAL